MSLSGEYQYSHSIKKRCLFFTNRYCAGFILGSLFISFETLGETNFEKMGMEIILCTTRMWNYLKEIRYFRFGYDILW